MQLSKVAAFSIPICKCDLMPYPFVFTLRSSMLSPPRTLERFDYVPYYPDWMAQGPQFIPPKALALPEDGSQVGGLLLGRSHMLVAFKMVPASLHYTVSGLFQSAYILGYQAQTDRVVIRSTKLDEYCAVCTTGQITSDYVAGFGARLRVGETERPTGGGLQRGHAR